MKQPTSNDAVLQDPSDCLSKKLLHLLNCHQMNENDLAKKLQLPYNTIHRLLKGTTADPRVSTVQQIADYFGVSLDYLLNKNISHTFLEPQTNLAIPVFTWAALGQLDGMDLLKNTRASKWITVAPSDSMDCADNLFAIESTRSMQPRFPSNTVFIVHVDTQPIDGDLVLVRFKDNTLALRELVIDSPVWRLNPIISDSLPLLFNGKEQAIVGVIILTLIQTR